jgi:sugar lactone lactonase YvrE
MRRRFLIALTVVAAALLGGLVPHSVAAAAITPTSPISTLAGNGSARFAGDGGPAVRASLNAPRGQLAFGPDGSIYVADTNNNRIRRIAPNGVISTIAGTGVVGYSGDGGPAVNARLQWPHDVHADAAGNVWIADSANHRIRMVSPNGVIRTVVGTGVGGFNGDGLAGTATRINRPKAVRVSGSTMWFADGDNNRIRQLDLVTGLVRTVAGTGAAGSAGDGGPATQARISGPRMIVLDSVGNLYIADSFNHRIRRVGTNGVITTVAGTGVAGFAGDGGAATRARVREPRGIALADDRTLYIADTDNSRVRRVDLSTGIITTVVGDGVARFAGDGGQAIRASLRGPRGVAVDRQGRLLINDTGNNRVRVLGP